MPTEDDRRLPLQVHPPRHLFVVDFPPATEEVVSAKKNSIYIDIYIYIPEINPYIYIYIYGVGL